MKKILSTLTLSVMLAASQFVMAAENADEGSAAGSDAGDYSVGGIKAGTVAAMAAIAAAAYAAGDSGSGGTPDPIIVETIVEVPVEVIVTETVIETVNVPTAIPVDQDTTVGGPEDATYTVIIDTVVVVSEAVAGYSTNGPTATRISATATATRYTGKTATRTTGATATRVLGAAATRTTGATATRTTAATATAGPVDANGNRVDPGTDHVMWFDTLNGSMNNPAETMQLFDYTTGQLFYDANGDAIYNQIEEYEITETADWYDTSVLTSDADATNAGTGAEYYGVRGNYGEQSTGANDLGDYSTTPSARSAEPDAGGPLISYYGDNGLVVDSGARYANRNQQNSSDIPGLGVDAYGRTVGAQDNSYIETYDVTETYSVEEDYYVEETYTTTVVVAAVAEVTAGGTATVAATVQAN